MFGKVNLGLLAGLALLLLAGCPDGQQGGNGSAGGSASGGAPQSEPQVASLPEEEPEAAAVNTQPEGDNWVWTPRLEAFIGEKLNVQYKLAAQGEGRPWIGLIPEHVTATDASSNDNEDVSYEYTVDALEAAVNIDLPRAGRFRLRLFDSEGSAGRMLAESPVITVSQWPQGDLASMTPPYATINPVGTDKVEVQMGFPVPVYFEVPEGYTPKAWIAVVPVTVASRRAGDNDALDVGYWFLDGEVKGSFTWQPQQEGTFVYRLFPSEAADCEFTAQSEEFTVIPRAK